MTFERELRMWHNGDSLDLVHIDPSHTDTDIYINFHKADVLHLGDTFFNGMYPVIDESTGGSIGGMIRASEMSLAMVSDSTKIIPGHGPLARRATCKSSTTCFRPFATRWLRSRPLEPRNRKPWPRTQRRNSTTPGARVS